jgi:hypothetical protein
MAEYVLTLDDTPEEVAQQLIAEAGEGREGDVVWTPRANVPHGGVFTAPDEVAEAVLKSRTAAKAKAVKAQAKADAKAEEGAAGEDA